MATAPHRHRPDASLHPQRGLVRQLLRERDLLAKRAYALTSHQDPESAPAVDVLIDIEASIWRLDPQLARRSQVAWGDDAASLVHRPGTATGWCRLCRTGLRWSPR